MTDNSNKSIYVDRLIQAFPKTVRPDALAVFNILPLNNHCVRLIDGQIHNVDNLIFPENINVSIDNEIVSLPYRIYFNEPDSTTIQKLTDRQKTILYAIYLRHHDGHVRERHLKNLQHNSDSFIIPFIVQLIGEYVLELLVVIDTMINSENIALYKNFIRDNELFWRKTSKRMVSYWNIKHRQTFPVLKNYIGTKIVDRLNKTTA